MVRNLADHKTRFVDWLVQARRRIAVVSMIVVTIAAAGLLRLPLETDESIFFADDNPNYQAEQSLTRTYG